MNCDIFVCNFCKKKIYISCTTFLLLIFRSVPRTLVEKNKVSPVLTGLIIIPIFIPALN